MKKILSLICAISLSTSASLAIISCSNNNEDYYVNLKDVSVNINATNETTLSDIAKALNSIEGLEYLTEDHIGFKSFLKATKKRNGRIIVKAELGKVINNNKVRIRGEMNFVIMKLDNNSNEPDPIWPKTKKAIYDNNNSELVEFGWFTDKRGTICIEPILATTKKVPTDLPEQITSLRTAFYENRNEKIEGIEEWNLSEVTDMSSMFSNARNFNQDLSSWDVSNVTNMSYMFSNARNFNQDISKWDVSNVTNMSYMFSNNSSFNQDLSSWDVSNVTNLSYMFSDAWNFNQDISKWDVSNVTNMSGMFQYAKKFNKKLSFQNTSNVTNMSYMFSNAWNFNQDLSSWDVSNVTDMSYMFNLASVFNQDLSSWNVNNVKKMNYMFHGALDFNGNISNWNTINVINMKRMFSGLNEGLMNFNQDISKWDVSNVTDMSGMFWYSFSFSQDLSKWKVSNRWVYAEQFASKEQTNFPKEKWPAFWRS
ncbi:BspA family leucine-rich repeat surface protein [Mesoplasma entomophilum]|uniref:BspA family leucine-rich repeat surface protein n=1 Tax=Mesoplasma entomophilum TaxID=2149 RepID=UPI000D228178|nr:BspA family leucine-rich repeat surface protein [Mesoplasma entomophilum]AVN60327.1 BspA family leucine-rich repeat surface protein [Mesoplasma entomophilum]